MALRSKCKRSDKPTCDLDVDVRLMHALHRAVEGDGATNGEQVHPVLGGVVRREQGLAVLLETLEALSLVPFTSRRRHRFLNEHLWIKISSHDFYDYTLLIALPSSPPSLYNSFCFPPSAPPAFCSDQKVCWLL